jgi:hypothetical protein
MKYCDGIYHKRKRERGVKTTANHRTANVPADIGTEQLKNHKSAVLSPDMENDVDSVRRECILGHPLHEQQTCIRFLRPPIELGRILLSMFLLWKLASGIYQRMKRSNDLRV